MEIKPSKTLKSYRLKDEVIEQLDFIRAQYGYLGERDNSAFMNEFLSDAIIAHELKVAEEKRTKKK